MGVILLMFLNFTSVHEHFSEYGNTIFSTTIEASLILCPSFSFRRVDAKSLTFGLAGQSAEDVLSFIQVQTEQWQNIFKTSSPIQWPLT